LLEKVPVGILAIRFVRWLGISASKFYNWRARYGKVNEHNSWMPRDFWLEDCEKQAIQEFFLEHPDEGYRRLAFMMLDADIVVVSPSSVFRVLSAAGLLRKWNRKKSGKRTCFVGPTRPHEHRHVDIAYLNIASTFYYLCSVLDGYSRSIVHWEIRESMSEPDVEIILQRAREKYPLYHPRVISDNGPQFIARDFKEFMRISGMSHVRTSSYYPQSNGKIERWHHSLKRQCIRPFCPLSLEEARSFVEKFVEHYNTRRLHNAIGYVSPYDKLHGRDKEIFAERDRKLQQAREKRAEKRRLVPRGYQGQMASVPAPAAG
jgi:transposase InsO family protein